MSILPEAQSWTQQDQVTKGPSWAVGKQGPIEKHEDAQGSTEHHQRGRHQQGGETKNKVFAALDNATANGYDERADDPMNVALDLVRFDAELESIEPEELVPFVEEWQKGGPRDEVHPQDDPGPDVEPEDEETGISHRTAHRGRREPSPYKDMGPAGGSP